MNTRGCSLICASDLDRAATARNTKNDVAMRGKDLRLRCFLTVAQAPRRNPGDANDAKAYATEAYLLR